MKFTIINLLILLFGAAVVKGDVCQVTDNKPYSDENQFSLCINGQVYMTLKFPSDSNTQCTTTCTTTDPPTINPGGPRDPNRFCKDMGVTGSFRPDEDDTCTKFIVCYQKSSTMQGLLKTCNTGYYFDPIQSICTPVKPNTCSPIITTSIPPTASPNGPRDPNTLCKDMGSTTGTYKADGDDTCTKFVACYFTGSTLQGLAKTCPNGYFFDPILHVCSSVKPDSCISATTTKPPTTIPAGPRDPITLCKDMGTAGIFKPDDDDTCMKFIVCYISNSAMQSLLKSCNTGHYFDPIERMCTPVKPDSCTYGTTTNPPTTSPAGPRDPITLCKDMGTAGIFKPDDDETCMKFIVCYIMNSTMQSILDTCNTGHYFDSIERKCTSVKPDSCTSATTINPPPTSPGGPRDPSTLCKDISAAGSYKADDDDSCKKFIVCYITNSSIQGVLKTCIAGYYFDPIKRTCTPQKPNGCSS